MRQIIILSTPPSGNPDTQQANGVFWLSVPEANQRWLVNPTATSIVPNIVTDELDLLKSGAIVEREFHLAYPSTFTAQDIATELSSRFDIEQARITNDTTYQWQGIYRDETGTWYTPGPPPTPIPL